MTRTLFETALVVAAIILGLEAIHYRTAVLEANVDRDRAWRTVIELRRGCHPETGREPVPQVPASRPADSSAERGAALRPQQ
jgi:hypothetical protein